MSLVVADNESFIREQLQEIAAHSDRLALMPLFGGVRSGATPGKLMVPG